MTNKDFQNPPTDTKPPRRQSRKEWTAEQLKKGYKYAFNYTPEQLKEYESGKAKSPEFYDPSKFKMEGDALVPLDGVNEPPTFINYPKAPVIIKQSPAPKRMPVEGVIPTEFGSGVNKNPNTGKYFNPETGEEIIPIITNGGIPEQKAKGGLVGKTKKYAGGGTVDPAVAPKTQGPMMGTKTQGVVSGLAGPLSALGTTAATAIDAANVANEKGEVNEGKAALAGGVRWASAAAPIAANPALLAATGGLSALAIPVAGGIGAIVAARKSGEANDKAVQEFEKQQIEDAKAKQAITVSEAMRQRELGYSKGGKIVGKGTGTSDGITAKVREGSFIVPAKNAEVAEEIKEKVLRKAPSKKANLKQDGGTDVKLSNGEYMFTPEEVNELASKGIDLNALAPEARHELDEYMKCGGSVKGYAKGGSVSGEDDEKFISDKRKELDELKKQLDDAAEQKSKSAAQKRDAENKRIAYEAAKKRFDESVEKFQKAKKQYEGYEKALKTDKYSGGTEANIPRLQSQLRELDKLRQDMKSKADVIAKYNPSQVKSSSESTTKVKPYTAGGEEVDLTRPKETEEAIKSTAPETTVTETKRAAPPKRTVAKPKMEIDPIETEISSLRDLEGINKPDYNQMAAEQAKTQMAQNAANKQVQSPQINPVTGGANDTTSGANTWQNGLTQALGYGIPAIQTAIGASALSKMGSRPIDKLDPEYLASIEQAKGRALQAEKEAQFGLTPQENFLLGQENQGLLNQARAAARNYSGGSGTTAFQQERMGIQDAYGRGLLTKVRDNALKLQKQGIAADRAAYADQLIAGKTDMNRRLFNDTLTAWKENQMAGGNLMAQGLTNAMSQNRYNQFLQNRESYQ